MWVYSVFASFELQVKVSFSNPSSQGCELSSLKFSAGTLHFALLMVF